MPDHRTNGEPVDLQVTTTPFEVDGENHTLFTGIDIGDAKRRRALERIFFYDILNTATGVWGLSSLVRTVDEQELEKVLELLESTSAHLIDEIQAERELLAAENYELVVCPQLIDAGKLLAKVADVYRAHDVARQKSIVIYPSAEQVRFLADPTLLGRVVFNLVKNALEATQEGGTVRLGCRRAGSRISFSVHNDTLIPEDSQLQIFQRSFTTKGDGRDLGIYGARLITERYLNGENRFESVPGSGTTFTVSCPFARSARVPRTRGSRCSQRSGRPTQSRRTTSARTRTRSRESTRAGSGSTSTRGRRNNQNIVLLRLRPLVPPVPGGPRRSRRGPPPSIGSVSMLRR